MISQVFDRDDQIGFMNTAMDKKGKCVKVDEQLSIKGHELETLFDQFGEPFPIKVKSHTVVNNNNEAYMLVDGKKIPLDKEKADKSQKAQERKGLLNSQQGMDRD